MTDSSYEILCSSCRSPIPSTAEVCPVCGHEVGRGVLPPLPMRTEAAPPAQAPPPPVFTPGLQVGGTRAYAGFWIRVAAWLVDDILIGVPFYLLTRSFGDLGFVFLFVGSALYFPLLESSSSQGTVGKLIFGLKVTDTSYRRISIARAFGRYLAHIPSGVILYLGYVMVAFTPQKRALHDYIAGTLVLRV